MQGDSGSASMCSDRNDKSVLCGLVSGGVLVHACGDTVYGKYIGTFTQVAYYR